MDDLEQSAARIRGHLEEILLQAVYESCERGLAHARLGHALRLVVQAVDHLGLTHRRREHSQGETWFVELVGRPLMRWCFSCEHVDVYCDGEPKTHLRLRYTPDGEWHLSAPGRRAFVGSFRGEEAKIVEMLEDALRSVGSSVESASVSDAGRGNP